MISTPDAHFFGSEQPSDTSLRAAATLRELCSARWPNARIFPASGMPKFRNFCISFAHFWRNIRVISTPNASLFGSKRIFHSKNLSDVFLKQAQRLAGRVHAVLVRAARRISGNFAISSREFGAKLAGHRRQTRTFSHFDALMTRSRAAMTFFGTSRSNSTCVSLRKHLRKLTQAYASR